MKKLRIVSQEHCGKTIYKVQQKKWYGWVTESIYRTYVDMVFETIEEAELYILKIFTKPKIKVVKNINVK
jgi:hypothetical protein